jgi:hypothetical protein
MARYQSLTLQRLDNDFLVKQLVEKLKELLEQEFKLHEIVIRMVDRFPSISTIAVPEFGYGQNEEGTRLLIRAIHGEEETPLMTKTLIAKELESYDYEVYFVTLDNKITDVKGNEFEKVDRVPAKHVLDEAIFIYS